MFRNILWNFHTLSIVRLLYRMPHHLREESQEYFYNMIVLLAIWTHTLIVPLFLEILFLDYIIFGSLRFVPRWILFGCPNLLWFKHLTNEFIADLYYANTFNLTLWDCFNENYRSSFFFLEYRSVIETLSIEVVL